MQVEKLTPLDSKTRTDVRYNSWIHWFKNENITRSWLEFCDERPSTKTSNECAQDWFFAAKTAKRDEHQLTLLLVKNNARVSLSSFMSVWNSYVQLISYCHYV